MDSDQQLREVLVLLQPFGGCLDLLKVLNGDREGEALLWVRLRLTEGGLRLGLFLNHWVLQH